MTTINKLRSKAFQIAHEVKSMVESWSTALKIGWVIAKLFSGISLDIEFAKGTGELRKAKAIAIGSLDTIKRGFLRFVESVEDGRTQWRSFKIDRLIF